MTKFIDECECGQVMHSGGSSVALLCAEAEVAHAVNKTVEAIILYEKAISALRTADRYGCCGCNIKNTIDVINNNNGGLKSNFFTDTPRLKQRNDEMSMGYGCMFLFLGIFLSAIFFRYSRKR